MLMLLFFIMIIMLFLNSSVAIYFLYKIKDNPASYSLLIGLNITAVIGESISLLNIINQL